ncbi:MAG: hypothetical protein CM15mV11_2870 [Caudoviricetes sp.]|nr:MAG: hypothetical protein CM15mV11_2870 [Caudoviricetes sp.]
MVTSGNDPYIPHIMHHNGMFALHHRDNSGLSIYAKAASTAQTCQLFLFEAPDVEVIQSHNTSFTITTSWQRFSITRTLTMAVQQIFKSELMVSEWSNNTIWWVGAQLERASSASTFADGGPDTAKEDSPHDTGSIQYNAETQGLRLYKDNVWVNEAGTTNVAGAVGTIGTGGGFTVAEGAINTNHQAVWEQKIQYCLKD